MMVLWCMLLAPIHSYIRLRAKSVLAAAVLHGTLNGTAGLSLMVVKGGNDLLIGISGLAGMIVLLMVNISLYIYERAFAKEPVEMP